MQLTTKGTVSLVTTIILTEVLYECVCVPQDVLYTICNNCGPVQRIVIFRKNGVQAMVEYPFYLCFFILELIGL